MKTCSRCKRTLDLSSFNKNRCKKDGLSTFCKDCNRKDCRKYYKASTPKQLKEIKSRNQKYRLKVKAQIDALKTRCVVCGENETCCLDFHHIDPKIKTDNVARLVSDYGPARIIEEIKKCVVVCSNCHRKIHAKLIVLDSYL